MEPASKPGTVRGLLVRLLLFGVAALLLRLAYVVSVHGGSSSCASSGDFCFFSSPESLSTLPGGTTTASFIRVADGSATITPALRALWTSREWRKAVDFYSAAFQDLVAEGFLSRTSKTLCVDAAAGHEVLALKELGVADSIGIARKKSPPLVISADLSRQPFKNDTFDFVFSGRGGIERSSRSTELAEEIVRTLRPEGFLAIHTFSAGDQYSLRALLDLFPSFRMVRSREIGGPDSTLIREIVLQKKGGSEIFSSKIKELGGISVNKCPVPEHKLRLLKSAEPLIKEEPLKPWITLKRNIKNVKYLPSMADISFKRRYIYIDVGARSYGSSIGSWFKKQYPKQNHTFDIYAIEADPAFHKEYAMKKRVNLMPYAAWVRNETLSFEVNHDPDHKEVEKGQGMGRIWTSGAFSGGLASGDVHKIKGFDFAEWLKTMVTERDFVVMKMDVEGTEFDLVPRLFETGAICLIDELFLECHYNRWQRCCPGERSPKYKKTYGQCLGLLTSLRESGVLVHQWW